jgi:hypothetical protein
MVQPSRTRRDAWGLVRSLEMSRVTVKHRLLAGVPVLQAISVAHLLPSSSALPPRRESCT